MAKVKEILQALWAYAPEKGKMEGDNVGLLAGREETETDSVLVCLDITSQTVEEAARLGAKLLVSHHPLLFSLRRVTGDTAPALVSLLEHGMSAICMHTNLDAAAGGVNDALAEAIGLQNPEAEAVDEAGRPCGFFRAGFWQPGGSAREFAAWVKQALNAPEIQLIDAGRPVRRVGLCSGSGLSELPEALSRGCDTFLTGEAKYSGFLEVRERGVNLVAAGHFATEAVVLPRVADRLRRAFPALRVEQSRLQRTPYETL